jgi:hypothetical protein
MRTLQAFSPLPVLKVENMKKALFLIAVAAVAASFGATARSADEAPAVPVDMVILSDGDAQTGCVTDITPTGTLVLATEYSAKPVEIALTRVANINLNTKDPDLSRRIRKGWIFYAADGTRITGRLRSWADDFVTVHIDYGADVKIPRANLLRISLNGQDFFGQAEGDKPMVFLANSDQKVAGAIKEINGDKVVVAGASDQSFRISELQGIALPQTKATPIQSENAALGWYAFVDMPNADRMIGQIDGLSNGTLYLITRCCGVLEIKRNYIAKMTFSPANRQAFGNTLIADSQRNLIIEVDPQGKEVWSHKCQDPLDARMLPNGDLLITSGLTGTVSEIDKKGNIVWIKNGLQHPVSAVFLPNGDIAVAESGNFRIVIFDRQGNQVRTLLEGKVQPNWVDVTPQGTLLVTDSSSVLEVDMDGNIVWQLGGMQGISCARALPGGEVGVIESAANKLRIFKKPAVPLRIIDLSLGQRSFTALSNGNILVIQHNIGDTTAHPIIREINPEDGKTVHETTVESTGFLTINSIDRN